MFGCLIWYAICQTSLEKLGIVSKIVIHTVVSKVCRQVYFVAGIVDVADTDY